MILGDHGPQSTITEDLTALGMEHLLEGYGGKKKKKKGGYGKDKMSDDDEPASPRQPIPVRQEDDDEDDDDDDDDEGKEKYDFGKKKKEEDEFEIDEDDDEIDEDEDEDDEDLTNAIAEFIDENDLLDVDEGELLEAITQITIEDDETEIDPKADAAREIIEQFQSGLAEFAESQDDNDKPSYDDLVGVIEAHEYLSEVAAGSAARGKMIFRHGKRHKVTGGEARAGIKKAKAVKRLGTKAESPLFKIIQTRPGVFKAKRKTTSEKRTGKRLHLKGRSKRARHAKLTRARAHSDVEPTGSPISELVDNLNALREAVRAPTEEDEGNDGKALVEGLKAIHDTAVTFYERIASELREDEDEDDDEGIDESDGRVAVGRHLEKIAEDASNVACGIVEGTSDLDDAAGDLQNLAADLNDVMEAMKAIE